MVGEADPNCLFNAHVSNYKSPSWTNQKDLQRLPKIVQGFKSCHFIVFQYDSKYNNIFFSLNYPLTVCIRCMAEYSLW